MTGEFKAEGDFLRLIEVHEQRVLDMVSLASDDKHFVRCTECGSSCEVQFYIQQTKCADCRPPVTLEADTLDTLMAQAREDLFEELSELDAKFSEQDHIKLRDSILEELTAASNLAEASADAAAAILDRVEDTEFDEKEYNSLVRDLLRLRIASKFSTIFGLSETVTQEVLKHRVEDLFVKKKKKTIQIGSDPK